MTEQEAAQAAQIEQPAPIPKRTVKYPLKYSEAAVILYLLSMEINNLLKEVRDKSPIESRQLAEDAFFTPEQIAEARKHFTGFVKQAIAIVAKRQTALNMVELKKQHLRMLLTEVEDGAALALQHPSYISEEGFKHVEKALKALKKSEEDILAIESSLRKDAKIINDLLAKHGAEWRRHQMKYITQLIAELESKGILLSELEKNELKGAMKTIDEVKQNLKKQALIKEK